MEINDNSDPLDLLDFLQFSPVMPQESNDLFIKQEEQEMEMNSPEGEAKKISFKNKYKNKIKKAGGEASTGTHHKFIKESEAGKEKHIDLDKKERNKLAAKESRDRKKLYIQITEKQIKEIELQLQNTNKDIELAKIQIQKATFANNQYIGELTSKLAHVQKKMAKLIEDQMVQERNNELNLSIDSICYRMGATGKERKFNINESYKQIFNLTIPTLQRYLLWSAHQNLHIFTDNNQQNLEQEFWFKETKKQMGYQGKDHQLIDEKRKVLQKQRQIIMDLVRRLNQTKFLMEKQGADLDNLFLDVRQFLTPLQSAKFILFIEKYKYRDELRYHERIAAENEEDDESLGLPNKKRKI